MKTTVKLLAAALLLSGLSVTPGRAATTCGGTVTVKNLCTVTKITTSTTGMVRVNLAKPARLWAGTFETPSGFAVSGKGRVYGAILTSDPPDPSGVMLVNLLTSAPFGGGVQSAQGVTATDDGYYRLPAGRYRIYVLADGSPVTVTLRLRDVTSATQTLATTATSGYKLREVAIPELDASGLSRAGAINGTLSRTGLLGRFLGVASVDPAVSMAGDCYWDGPAPSTRRPVCADSTQRTVNQPLPTGGGATASIAGTVNGPLPAGTYGQGAYVETTSRNVVARSMAFWLPL